MSESPGTAVGEGEVGSLVRRALVQLEREERERREMAARLLAEAGPGFFDWRG